MTTEEMLLQLLDGQKHTNERLDKIDKHLSKIDEDIEELKEESEITRSATNTLIEKLEEFAEVYNALHSPEFKV